MLIMNLCGNRNCHTLLIGKHDLAPMEENLRIQQKCIGTNSSTQETS
jgi:hypothetical protein